MLLKFMYEDSRATGLAHNQDFLGKVPDLALDASTGQPVRNEPGATVRWVDRFGPTVKTIIDGVERIEHGGPLDIVGEAKRADTRLPDIPVERDDLRNIIIGLACELVPMETGNVGSREIIDCTSRSGLAPSLVWARVYWVKAYLQHPDRSGGSAPVLIFHDSRAYLCDDQGQTLERLGD